MYKSKSIYIIILLSYNYFAFSIRSAFRPCYKKLPKIVSYWKNKPDKKHSLRDTHLEQDPIFNSFDYNHFISNQIPKGEVTYRNENKTVTGSKLCKQLNILIKELKDKKTKFKHFKLLKNNDFNTQAACGNVILKFKDYPFVAKVFMEKPRFFVKPFSKGWQPSCLYIISGGINRYLSGFKRIKNLNKINEKIKKHHYWSKKLATPRKWFYLPPNTKWFCLEGHNIGPKKYNYIELPATYIVIADAIDKEKELSFFNTKDRQFGITLSKFFGNRVDPHIDNFVIEKKTKKIVLIDTEHFPSIIGIKQAFKFESYVSWYVQLSRKFIKDKWGRNKPMRKKLQKSPTKVILPC